MHKQFHQIGLNVFRFVDCTISVVPFPPLSPPGVGSYGWVMSPTRGAPTPSIAPGRDGWPRIPNIFATDDRRAPWSHVQRLVVNNAVQLLRNASNESTEPTTESFISLEQLC